MSDPQKEASSRGSALNAGREAMRRRDFRDGRRTFRSWPLLPLPPGHSASKGRSAPSLDWPQGHVVLGAEEWQDKPDRRDLGQDFEPRSQARPWQDEELTSDRVRHRRLWRAGLLASVALHLSLAAFLITAPSPETVDIAGGGAVTVMLVGEQAFDSLAAGDSKAEESPTPVDEMDAQPAEQEPTEATALEAQETPVEPVEANNAPVDPVAETEPPPVQPVEQVTPEEPTEQAPEAPTAVAPQNVAINADAVSETGELEPEPPTVIEDVSADETPTEMQEPKEVAADELQPLPERTEKTAVKEPPKEKPKKATAPKKADKVQKARKVATKSSKGEAGDASANAQKGSSDSQAQASRFDPGNAAVSNYPGKIASKLRRALKYPKSAVSGRGGEAQVAFTVQADGSATSIRVVSSSGSPVLDQAAVDAVRRASPFPPIPPEAGRRQWPFAVPVLFRR